METVSHILATRSVPPRGLESMVIFSLVFHGALIALLIVATPDWNRSVTREVMTISLGGAAGPDTGGSTPISARPIQRAVAEPPTVPAPTRAPAAAVPEMTVPAPEATRRARTPVDVSSPSPERTGSRAATTGPEEVAGTAVADTGARRGEGFGLSSGGGQGTGAYLDVGNFCCPGYLDTMQQLIRRNWNQKQPAGGDVGVKFTILRDGTIASPELERSSGHGGLDLESVRAVERTRRLPPLPAQFTDQSLVVHVVFQYVR